MDRNNRSTEESEMDGGQVWFVRNTRGETATELDDWVKCCASPTEASRKHLLYAQQLDMTVNR